MGSSPSATVYQGPEFARAWWRTYGGDADLAIAEARSLEGDLVGQLVLARTDNLPWAPIGFHQAEYSAALSHGNNRSPVVALLQVVRWKLGIGRLRLRFLPPNSPVQGYLDACVAGRSCTHQRAIRRFKDVKTPGRTSRRKLAALRKMGAEFEVLRDAGGVARFLDEFVPMHDARQVAQGWGAPFRKDPRKRTFLLALAEEANLLHAVGLRIQGKLVAGLVGVQDGSHLIASLLAHDPEFKKLSPLAALVHELGNLYVGTDIDTLDLTPGGEYKERFATEYDTAYALDIAWTPITVAKVLTKRHLAPVARRLRALRRNGTRPDADDPD